MENSHTTTVKNYYNSTESHLGYSILLKGVRHFGYYPKKDKSRISFGQAQENMTRKVAEKMALPPGSRVLDAGFGEGLVALYFAKHFKYHVEAIDFMESNLVVAEKHKASQKIDSVHFQVMDYNNLNFSDNFFDGIYTIEALVHTPYLEKTLSEFYRVLKSGGVLVNFEYLLDDYLPKEEEKIWHTIYDRGGMIGVYNKLRVSRALGFWREAGFTDVSCEDLSLYVKPFLRRLHNLARIPFFILKLFRKEKRFFNVYIAVKSYPIFKSFHYSAIVAYKPQQ